MELRNFIKTALIEIAEAVKEADVEYEKMGGSINPKHVYGDGSYTYTAKQSIVKVSNIEFSLMVTESENKSNDKTGGINLKVLTGKIGDSKNSIQAQVNTIKFSIPLVLPVSGTNANTEARAVF